MKGAHRFTLKIKIVRDMRHEPGGQCVRTFYDDGAWYLYRVLTWQDLDDARSVRGRAQVLGRGLLLPANGERPDDIRNWWEIAEVVVDDAAHEPSPTSAEAQT